MRRKFCCLKSIDILDICPKYLFQHMIWTISYQNIIFLSPLRFVFFHLSLLEEAWEQQTFIKTQKENHPFTKDHVVVLDSNL